MEDLSRARNRVNCAATGHPSAPASTRFRDLVPGVILLFIVGYAGKFVEHFLNTWTKAHHITFPNIEYVLWAILFGIIIAIAGCMQGMHAGRNAAAVGQAATSAVVLSIVWIVVADGLFAVLCNVLGI